MSKKKPTSLYIRLLSSLAAAPNLNRMVRNRYIAKIQGRQAFNIHDVLGVTIVLHPALIDFVD
jgi:hypothetical protein